MMRLSAESKRMLAVALYTFLGCAVSLYVASRLALDTTAALSGFRLFFVHLQVFVEAMWARFQGTYVEFVAFKEEWYSAAAIMPSTSYVLAVLSAYFFMDVVVPLLALTENLRFLPAAIVFDFVMVPYTLVIVARSLIYILLHVDDYVWVYAYATFVLTVWAWTDSRPFRAASIAFGLVVAAPYTLGKVGLTLLLAFVYPILGALASDLFLNVVGWVLGSRVTTWVRKWPPVSSWAGVAFGLWDAWRDDSYGRKMLVWMLTLMGGAASSTASWIAGLLEPLKSQRVINAVIHDLSKPNWHEGAERVFRRERVAYEFGKVVPTPAPAPASRGALTPANSPQRLPKKPRT